MNSWIPAILIIIGGLLFFVSYGFWVNSGKATRAGVLNHYGKKYFKSWVTDPDEHMDLSVVKSYRRKSLIYFAGALLFFSAGIILGN